MRQYDGAGHWWSTVLRVTPEGSEREPAWLMSRIRVPTVPDKKAVAEFSGGYIVGEGGYRVDMLLVDDRDRACTASWSIRAKMSSKVRQVRPGIPPGAVDDLAMRRWRVPRASADDRKYNVAVLLHASAAVPNRVRLRDYDRMLLLSALASLAERLPANLRLSVFSMDRQKEIYHTPELSRESFGQAMEALDDLELGTVDYATLQNKTGHLDLLSELLRRETSGDNPPDAVIVLGPVAHSFSRMPAEALPAPKPDRPVYYVQLRPWRLLAGVGADTISHAVKSLGGKTRQVYSPEDFAQAISELERLLESTD